MNDEVRRTLNLAWLPMTGPWLIDQLWSHPERLRALAPWLTEEQVRALAREKGAPLTRSDIPLLDEAMELLGPDPKAASRISAQDAARAEEEQFARDTLAQAGIGSGIVTAQMLVDNLSGDAAEPISHRAASDREWTYGHIVVDEAQELTDMDWRMLIRRCPSRSFTIVGDVAQTAALGGTRSWPHTMNRLFGERNWTLNELTINYRNPKEVSELASRFARNEGLYISTVNAVRTIPDSVRRVSVEDRPALLDEVAATTVELTREFISDDGTGRIAVIAPDDMLGQLRPHIDGVLRRALPAAEYERLSRQGEWERQVNVCDTEMVKGLEFDAVIVVEPGQVEQQAPSRLVAAADLYVAMTRPTQRLFIVRTREDENNLVL